MIGRPSHAFNSLMLVYTQLDAATTGVLMARLQDDASKNEGGLPDLFHLPHVRLWTKIRPGARQLLTGIVGSSLCEVLVYTMGDRSYADRMAQLLDPQGRVLRSGRVIAAGDSTVAGVKDLDVVLGDARGVLVVDDTRGVWAKHGSNVIVPERYHFFPSSAASFGASPRSSYLARGTDEDVDTGPLAAVTSVIQHVHAAFFAAEAERSGTGDVRKLLTSHRASTLAGVVVLFSGVIPVKNGGCSPEEHPTWRTALELGARCVAEQCDEVTHVVVQRAGTDKHRWAARRPHVLCVTPAWLTACSSTWSRVPESKFAVADADAGPTS